MAKKGFKMSTISIIILVVIAALVVIVVILRSSPNSIIDNAIGGEDGWIKDGRGVYVKHGNPSSTPQEVLSQQVMIANAMNLYTERKASRMVFESQCLGFVSNDEKTKYSVDIVSVPKNALDNLEENQCSDYLTGKTTHFIELDKEGNVVRIV